MIPGLKVFIVGSPRSGTSITYYAMREVFQLKGRGESHVFPIFQRAIHQFYVDTQKFAKMSGVLAGSLDTRSFREHLQSFLEIFYARAYNNSGFVDKTPGADAIRCCTLIKQVFPDAKIILMQRNGIEVVSSFREKFSSSFENACLSWQQVSDASQRTQNELPEMLVIDQFDLTNAPESTANRITKYLEQPGAQHSLASFFVTRRVEQQSSHDWRQRLVLADTDWSDSEKATFVKICGPSMAALGYSI